MTDITMPQLGETVTEGTITKWFKKVGEAVAEDEALFEVSTDKVDSEVPSAAAGYVTEILVQEGETVDVGTRLAVLAEQPTAGSEPAADAPSAPAEARPTAEAGEADNGAGFENIEETRGEDDGNPPAKAEAEAADAAADAAPGEAASPAPAATQPSAGENGDRSGNGDQADPAPGGVGARQGVLSPVVRKMLAEHALDAGHIQGTGRQGRITRSDVLAHLDKFPSAPAASGPSPKRAAPAPSTAPAAPTDAPSEVPTLRRQGETEAIPFSNIRRRTAEHMVRSQATSAHVLVAIEVDFENVDRVRLAQREQFKAEEGFSLTYLPFVSRAVVDAILEFPHVNASVGENQLLVHHHVHLGFAVDLSFEGLIVPVVHNADDKRLRTIARELSDLAARARGRKLTADEISGSTFTITNPGSYGTLITAPVINQPQVAILSTDGVKKRPVVVELADGGDAVAIHRVGNLAMSFDHRAFDGAYASAFVARVKEILETRDWAAEL